VFVQFVGIELPYDFGILIKILFEFLIIYTITAFRKHFFWPSWPENVFISASH
jgi:hypothetical protein